MSSAVKQSPDAIDYRVNPVETALRGSLRVPGDKSISHRALILASLAEGVSEIEGCLDSADTRATLAAFREMGVRIRPRGRKLVVTGVGLHGLAAPAGVLDCGNSGTAARLLLGILAGQRFDATLIGDASLSRRPMRRVAEPLNAMNADVRPAAGETLPVTIKGNRRLHGIEYELPVASAQLKSALLLAGLYAAGKTALVEPAQTRDHTERLLAHFGRPVVRAGERLEIEAGALRANSLCIPGDISSAAFFLAAGCIVPGSELIIEKVGINPTRSAVVDILRLMGADIGITRVDDGAVEPLADIRVKYRQLQGISIPAQLVPAAIDEFPAIMAAACYAKGETVLADAAELRVKESDRIQALADGLGGTGIDVEVRPDGLRVSGGRPRGGVLDSYGDHRIAMALCLTGLAAEAPTTVTDCKNVDTSFPDFIDCAKQSGWDIDVTAPAAAGG